jgi:hypothetical protein
MRATCSYFESCRLGIATCDPSLSSLLQNFQLSTVDSQLPLPFRKSFPHISFADPHPLTLLESYRFKERGEGDSHLRTSDVQTTPGIIQFIINHLRTLLRNGNHLSLSLSTICILFSSRRRVPPALPRDSVHALPPVPLRHTHFGATIRNGTEFLHDPGKQLRSPRCLRLRERTSGTVRLPIYPDRVGVASRAWVQGSKAGSGFVLTNPE